MTENGSRAGEKGREREKRRDDRRRSRAFAAVLEPRLISPITPYSAATHDPPTLPPALSMLVSSFLSPLSLSFLRSCPLRYRFLAARPPPPILLGATMERLTRSSPRRHPLRARASTLSRRALASLHRLYTTSVDEVCLTRGSLYRTYYRFPPPLAASPTPHVPSPSPRAVRHSVYPSTARPPPPPLFLLLVLLVPRTSSMVHGR